MIPVTHRMTAFGEYEDDGTASTLKQWDYKDATDLVVEPVALSFHENQRGELTVNATAGALGNGGGKPGRGYSAVAFKPSHFTRGKDGAPSEVVPPLSADADKGDQEAVVAFHRNASCSVTAQDDITAALRSNAEHSNQFLQSGMQVRRLTPTECERLQSFPDGWTKDFSDSVRYRMLGNAVCVNVAEWIGRRMVKAQITIHTGGSSDS